MVFVFFEVGCLKKQLFLLTLSLWHAFFVHVILLETLCQIPTLTQKDKHEYN